MVAPRGPLASAPKSSIGSDVPPGSARPDTQHPMAAFVTTATLSRSDRARNMMPGLTS